MTQQQQQHHHAAANIHVGATTAWHDTNRGVSLFIGLYIGLLLVVLTLSQWLHHTNWTLGSSKLSSLLPEAAMVILVGIVAGWIVLMIVGNDTDDAQEQEQQYYNNGEQQYELAGQVVDSLLSFSPSAFFVILLPPIIFNGGYHVHGHLFARHLSKVVLYACVGTTVCTVVVAALLYLVSPLLRLDVSFLELLAFGALISATDPVSTLAVFGQKQVDPHLFYLVFGESMINDAVGLVLFEAFAHLVEEEQQMANNGDGSSLNVGEEVAQFFVDFVLGFVGSLSLGTVFAIFFALFLKVVDFRHTPLLELCCTVTLLYLPFCLAELCHLSGIVATLFTGIFARRYAEPNLSAATAANADTVFRLTAHLTETIIFLELGLSVASLVGAGAFHVGFVVCSLVACCVGRAANIYPITYVYNYWVEAAASRRKAPTRNEQPLTELSNAAPQQQQQQLAMMTTPNKSDVDVNNNTPMTTTMIDDDSVPWSMAHMLWFSGLRGAVSYALVRTFPHTNNEAMFVATTMFIVLLTTFWLGGSTEWALEKLQIPINVNEEAYLQQLKPKKLVVSWLSHWERNTLRKWVIRDFVVSSGSSSTKLSPRSKGDVEIAPNRTAETMDDDNVDSPTRWDYKMQDDENDSDESVEVELSPKKGFLYDYGG